MLQKCLLYCTDEIKPQKLIELCQTVPWCDADGKTLDITEVVREAVLDLSRPECPKESYKFTHEEVDFFYWQEELGLHLPQLEGMPIDEALKEAERLWDGKVFEFIYAYRSDWHGGDSVHVTQLAFSVRNEEEEEWN